MLFVLTVLAVVCSARAIERSDAPAVVEWLCEKHAETQGSGFPAGWCADSGDICEWGGVTCTRNGILTAIDLFGVPLNSELDARAYDANCGRLILRDCGLRGTIAQRFDGVHNLDLAHNNLDGALPSNFFQSLTHVDLTHNRLTSVGDMCTVAEPHTLKLASNAFEDDLLQCSELINKFGKRLYHFDIAHNKFFGFAPFAKNVSVYVIEDNEFAAIEDMRPLGKSMFPAFVTFTGSRLAPAATAQKKLRLAACRIGESAFRNPAQAYDSMWFRADERIGKICK